MTTTIEATNFSLTDDTKLAIEEKLQKAMRGTRPTALHVVLTRSTHHNKGGVYECEVHVHLPKKILKAEITDGEDIITSIHQAGKKLERQLEKYKAKRTQA